jgi:inositol-pentakisphosphate 2-kinase
MTRKDLEDTANAGSPSLSRNSAVASRVSETAVPVVSVKRELVSTPTQGSSAPTVAGACAPSDSRKRKEADSEARSAEPRKKPCPERETNLNTQEGLQAMVVVAGPSMSRLEPVQPVLDPATPDVPTGLDALLQQTRPVEWKYLSEGGANVVYVYRGWREGFKNKALRIKKISPVVKSSQSERQSTTPNDYWQEKILPHVLRHVDRDARGLLPTRRKMRVTSLWISAMDQYSKKDRPAHRLQSGYADLERRDEHSLVVLTDDLIGGAGHIAIEIKPKAGFVPPTEGLDPRFAPVKTKACKYCMKRCVTNGQGDIGYGFCPIDLFSKDYAPRSRALQCLAEAWTLGDAGNNMKVFVDGEIVHSAVEAKPNANLGDYRDPLALARLVNNALSSSGVLDTLLFLQKLYDRKDIQELARLANQQAHNTQNPFNENLCIEPHATQWAEVCYRRSGGDRDPLASQRQISARYACMTYAIAAIFKDCSVMLRWPIDRLSAIAEQPCTVKLVDLDLKPLKNLNKWWQQDQDLCSAVQERGMTIACGAGGIQGSDYQIFRFPSTWKPAWEAVPKRSQRSHANGTEAAMAQLLVKAQSDNTILRERAARLERALMNIGVQVVEAGLQTR